MKKSILVCALAAAIGAVGVHQGLEVVFSPPAHAQVERTRSTPDILAVDYITVADEVPVVAGEPVIAKMSLGEIILAIVFAIGSLYVRKNHVDKTRLAFVQMGADIAYNVVNNIALTTQTKIDDKVAWALRELSTWLKANGQDGTLSPSEEVVVKQIFNAKHGAEAKLLPKVGTLAIAGGATVPPAPLAAS